MTLSEPTTSHPQPALKSVIRSSESPSFFMTKIWLMTSPVETSPKLKLVNGVTALGAELACPGCAKQSTPASRTTSINDRLRKNPPWLLPFLLTLRFRLKFLAESIYPSAHPCGLIVQLGYPLLIHRLLRVHVIERSLKVGSNRGLGFITPQSSSQHQLALDVSHPALNILLACVELRFGVIRLLEFIFQFRQSIFIKQQLEHRRIALRRASHQSQLIGEQTDLS